jgi:hypothetical protein
LPFLSSLHLLMWRSSSSELFCVHHTFFSCDEEHNAAALHVSFCWGVRIPTERLSLCPYTLNNTRTAERICMEFCVWLKSDKHTSHLTWRPSLYAFLLEEDPGQVLRNTPQLWRCSIISCSAINLLRKLE